jgi:N-acetylglucosamine-6-phosphate deacetylase
VHRPLLITNARIAMPTGGVAGHVRVVGGRISAVTSLADGRQRGNDDVDVIDADGRRLLPGFIDLQLNGGFGWDFTADPATIWAVAARLPRFGVTAFLPTIITSPLATVRHAQQVLAAGPPDGFTGAQPLGLHLEGPFLNPLKKGAHAPEFLQTPSIDTIAAWSPATHVRLVTLAPELPGALDVAAQLAAQGVVVSAGHSMATLAQATAGFDAGVRYGTHLFNAMPPAHHREPGLVGALLTDDRPTVGIIADGVHVHPRWLQLAWAAASQRLNLVSDGMAALGLGDGRYVLGDREVSVRAGKATLADGTLAGSALPLDAALRAFAAAIGVTVADVAATVSATPAALLGLTDYGRIAPGCIADMVLLTERGDVALTVRAGRILYTSERGDWRE